MDKKNAINIAELQVLAVDVTGSQSTAQARASKDDQAVCSIRSDIRGL